MISKELSATLGLAVREAKKRRHEYVCVEHVLYAILHDNEGVEIINYCGGSIETLKQNLETFFKDRLESLSDSGDYVLQQTVGFQRVIQRAVNHVRSAEKQEVCIGDILASIFQEKESHATFFLESENITRLAVLRYISHEMHADSSDYEAEKETKKESKTSKKSENPLELYTVDLVKKAGQGKLDPLVGRVSELQRIVQVLCRRRKNNPVFVGEPGVGKTAVAEGLAQRIFDGDVPRLLLDARIFSLDMSSVLAGTKFRGDFEQRLKNVLSELSKIKNVILFIDEIHTVVGAGATSSGSIDASNILKPVLTTHELRCMGATTYEEYKNHFEKDRALARRFEKIDIAEPSISETVEILHGLKSCYESHHKVEYTDAAIEAAASLSFKYINDRYLPDKAIDVIDEAGVLKSLEDGERVKKIKINDIEKIVAAIAKIPPKTVSTSDRSKLKNLEKKLKSFIFGQNDALESLSTSIKRSRAGLSSPDKPIGSFLFTGPTGVGKTEVAKQLAQNLGVEFIRFDMSEYMEKHAVARLIGAPPGYIGFEQGGLLTEQVRKFPHCVVLMDEIEKAHPDLINILLQVFDHGTLTDNNGKKADFRNVAIIMSSNAGAREMSSKTIGFGDPVNDIKDKGNTAIEKIFSPEFRNRLDAIITFNSLDITIMKRIVDKFMDELQSQLAEKNVVAKLTGAAKKWLATNGYDSRYGARPLARIIQTEVKDKLSDEILFGALSKGGSVTIGVRNNALIFTYNT